jgi:hypothetical protein
VKRNPAPKIWPALAWERDRYHPGTKNAHLIYGHGRGLLLVVSPYLVSLGRYHYSDHDGTLESIRDAATRATFKLKPDVRDAVIKALSAAEGSP